MLNAKQMQIEITRCIREVLEGSRFEGVRIAPEDDDEDVMRPSIKLMTETRYSKEMLVRIAETTVELFFYAENADDYTIDCMEVQELIEQKILKGMLLENDLIEPDNVDCSSAGGVLAITFTLEQMEPDTDEMDADTDDMETLKLGIK